MKRYFFTLDDLARNQLSEVDKDLIWDTLDNLGYLEGFDEPIKLYQLDNLRSALGRFSIFLHVVLITPPISGKHL